jgi:hypothetical protein
LIQSGSVCSSAKGLQPARKQPLSPLPASSCLLTYDLPQRPSSYFLLQSPALFYLFVSQQTPRFNERSVYLPLLSSSTEHQPSWTDSTTVGTSNSHACITLTMFVSSQPLRQEGLAQQELGHYLQDLDYRHMAVVCHRLGLLHLRLLLR